MEQECFTNVNSILTHSVSPKYLVRLRLKNDIHSFIAQVRVAVHCILLRRCRQHGRSEDRFASASEAPGIEINGNTSRNVDPLESTPQGDDSWNRP